MNTWLKIVIAAVALLVLLIVVVSLLPSSPKSPPPPEKTFYDVIKEDDARLRAEPVSKQPAQEGTKQPTQQVTQPVLKFKELSEEDEVEAEKLFEMAIMERKMGRLPVMGYNRMVDYCRQIIQRFPGSEFDYKARRILADIREQYRERYKITPEEIDLSKWPTQ